MSIRNDRVLQIVPHPPGTFDGVGDYALNLAHAFSTGHGITTTFLVAGRATVTSKDGYAVISGLNTRDSAELARHHEHAILHYVNYGYQARGVPFRLRRFVKQLRPHLRGRWVTTFHELYASGPPWKSAFWLRPFQVRIARYLIDASTSCIVSNPPIENAIHAHDPEKKVRFEAGPFVSARFNKELVKNVTYRSRLDLVYTERLILDPLDLPHVDFEPLSLRQVHCVALWVPDPVLGERAVLRSLVKAHPPLLTDAVED